MKKPAILLLENGHHFKGFSLGAIGTSGGEVCFNTSMTGYQEILTDPSYCGQIITMTAPQIGNYGVNPEDIESDKIQASGFIVREASPIHSNYRANQSLDDYLNQAGIVGIQGIDTRSLTRILRDEGAMNGIISSDDLELSSLMQKLELVPEMTGQDLVKEVTCQETWTWVGHNSEHSYRVVALDLGIKHNIIRQLAENDCEVIIVPATTSAEEILTMEPDGVFLSNGPGDPEPVDYAIETVKSLLDKKPIFGICLGHQILSLALGASTYKLKFGHRGGNHPVRNQLSGKVEITSQNHGFAVEPASLPNHLKVTHINLNDETLEGVRCKNRPAFSVQYHPEASPGPHDSRYLFKEFIDMMDTHAKKN
ncbi:MAG: glutamine-hydrolyzing carbamoyl-phosphate synthase small subunit [Candidatus Marinimicrobia bacterium]|jgi:carbamoyl-phosphate synthase small subunit|nr:glutamine-hydrolyzing carbamoyl-phosphate synthase small subunit [Candidatus Neomarinimicrobiota bacterium]MBT3631705.1 glutamine-hydrolyzing carbamoyl-phosphate synthase small subunit [Candidatus Neomarinimicrobiota bacterium]MBT3825906.1 glutamine-hydrolyzing carbamoyl-phosphate synthase small subunit [Candidatus Neomarinimicrobiota bacterium]MBT4130003.1 glutamine-hydrolyzing carbamoyl-phosphate synthase small subunit [Candidatus Neomarinimicrobiota bacterium]MBT4296011.1 glutamine-hydrol